MKIKKENITFTDSISKIYLKNKTAKKKTEDTVKNIDNLFRHSNKQKDTIHLLSKKFKFDFNLRKLKKYNKFKNVVIIGIGGSILGTKAIYQIFAKKIKKNFIFFDNLDEMKTHFFINDQKKKYLFIIISKSGNTIETLINVNLLQDFKLNKSNTIIITENKNNYLNNYAKKKNIYLINHKDYIGGRYSVLSEVGMVPAYFMGLKIKNFREKLLSYFNGSKKKILKNYINKITSLYISKKINNIIFFNYNPQLENFIFWCQQLIAESLGKKGLGLLPSIATGPKDHHSLLQLFLDGPKDKVFYIFSGNSLYNNKVKKNVFGIKNDYLKKNKLNNIILAQKKAFIKELQIKKIPYREIHINNFNESSLGELFSYFMLETIMVAKNINVNPFNQPGVEEVKITTKKLLS